MKKADVFQGRVYVVKVSGKLARVRIVEESPYGGWLGKNIDTGRDVRIKTAARLRRECVLTLPVAQDGSVDMTRAPYFTVTEPTRKREV